MNQINQLIDIAPQLKEQNAEVVCIFRETPPGKEAKDGIEGLRNFKQSANPPFPLAIDYGSRATAPYSTEGHFTTYVIGTDGNVAAELRGVKYIRPSAKAMAKAAATAN